MADGIDARVKSAENEVRDAIEHGDRKGRWYAEGKVDALKSLRIAETARGGSLNYAERNETLREVADMVRDFATFDASEVVSSATARAELAVKHAIAAAVEGMARK